MSGVGYVRGRARELLETCILAVPACIAIGIVASVYLDGRERTQLQEQHDLEERTRAAAQRALDLQQYQKLKAGELRCEADPMYTRWVKCMAPHDFSWQDFQDDELVLLMTRAREACGKVPKGCASYDDDKYQLTGLERQFATDRPR